MVTRTGTLLGLIRRPSTGVRLNTFLTTAGTAVSLVLSLVLRLVIARVFGPGALGLYALALGYQRVTGQIADAGLDYALLRRASGDPTLLRRGISLKMLIGLVVAIAVGIPWIVPGIDPDVRTAIALAAIGVFGWSQLDSAQLWLRGHGRFSADLFLHASMSVLRVIVAVAVLFTSRSVPLALAAYFLTPVLATPIVPLPWSRPSLPLTMLRDTAASFAFRTLWLLWLNVDLLVLGWVLDIDAVGHYEAPRSLAYPVLAIADGAAIAALQHLGSGRGSHVDAARALVRPALLAVLAMPLFALVATAALPILFGPTFASPELVAVFTLLLTAFIAASAAMPYASVLLFTRPRGVLAVTAADVVLAVVAYTFAAHSGIVVVAMLACVLQGLNLAALVILVRRMH